jgi:hypothetical protein
MGLRCCVLRLGLLKHQSSVGRYGSGFRARHLRRQCGGGKVCGGSASRPGVINTRGGHVCAPWVRTWPTRGRHCQGISGKTGSPPPDRGQLRGYRATTASGRQPQHPTPRQSCPLNIIQRPPCRASNHSFDRSKATPSNRKSNRDQAFDSLMTRCAFVAASTRLCFRLCYATRKGPTRSRVARSATRRRFHPPVGG